MIDTTKKAAEERSVNCAPVPDPREKVWVVLVCGFEERYGPKGAEIEELEGFALTAAYVLSPKGGGPASIYDARTWGDRSMAHQRGRMVQDRINKDTRNYLSPQVTRLGFVADERLHWSDGEPADGSKFERRAS